MGGTRHDGTAMRGDGIETPYWLEEATDPAWWDVAFGSYGDGYLEWVNDHYYRDPLDPRTVADTRSLWRHRRRYRPPAELPWLAPADGHDRRRGRRRHGVV